MWGEGGLFNECAASVGYQCEKPTAHCTPQIKSRWMNDMHTFLERHTRPKLTPETDVAGEEADAVTQVGVLLAAWTGWAGWKGRGMGPLNVLEGGAWSALRNWIWGGERKSDQERVFDVSLAQQAERITT